MIEIIFCCCVFFASWSQKHKHKCKVLLQCHEIYSHNIAFIASIKSLQCFYSSDFQMQSSIIIFTSSVMILYSSEYGLYHFHINQLYSSPEKRKCQQKETYFLGCIQRLGYRTTYVWFNVLTHHVVWVRYSSQLCSMGVYTQSNN